MKNVYIYARVSTQEQAEKGKSIETQTTLCKKWAKENNLQVKEIFTDHGESATNLNRAALQDMLAKCKESNDIIAVLVQDTDRLARNTLDHLTIKALLKKKEIAVISISQPLIDDSPEGNLIDTILASVNAFQSQITGRKTSKVLEQKAKTGWFPGGRPPLGYINIDNPNPTSTLDRRIIGVDTQLAPYMKQVLEMYATGNYSVDHLVRWMDKKGIKSITGGKMRISSLTQYLRNPFYTGKFLWNKKLYQGKHEPIISKAIYKTILQTLDARNQNASRTRKHDFLLRGFVYCSKCEKRLWAEKHKKKDGSRYEFYFCHYCRPRTYTSTKDLEKVIEKIVSSVQLSKEYVNQIMDTARRTLLEIRKMTDSDRITLAKQENKLVKAIQEAEDSRFINGTLTEEGFARIVTRYQSELSDVRERRKELESDNSEKVRSLEKVLRLAENIGASYKKADPALKRAYLGIFFDKFIIKDGKIKKYYLSPELKTLIEEGSVRVRRTGLRD